MRRHWMSISMIALAFLLICSPMLWAYEEVDVLNGGSIAGQVKFTGKTETLVPLNVIKDNNFCGNEKTNEELIVSEKGAVKNVVVTIENIEKGKKIQTGDSGLANKDCVYVPHVQAMVAGTYLDISNADPILHNTHGYLNGVKTVFNIALPMRNQNVRKKIKNPGLINVSCDAGHKWMSAYIAVVDNPYFAVTDENGNFEISNIPSGKYQLKAWHETLGTQIIDVNVKENGKVNILFDKLQK